MKKKIILAVFIIALTSLTAAQTRPSTNINVDLIKSEPVPLQTSEYADLWLKVTNDGNVNADNVNVTFTPTFPFDVDPDEKTSWKIGKLSTGQEYYIHLQVKVDENAVSGTNYLEFRTSSGNNDITITEKVPVEVRTDDAVLDVKSVEFPESVAPGSRKRMTLNLQNLADSHLKNIEVSLDLEDLPFATANTTSKRIQDLEPSEETSVSYTILTGSDAENGLYRLPLTLTYENEAGTEFTRETTTGVTVGGEPELEIGINSQDSFTPGKTGTVTFRIVNSGYGDASFVSLEVEETENFEIVSPSSVYIGDMASDDYQTAEFQVYTSSEEVEVPVKIRYRTATGETVELTEKVPLNVYNSDELSRYGMAGGGNTVLIIVVTGLLIVGGIYYWRRRKSREAP